MEVTINPIYDKYADFVRQVPHIFAKEGRTIYKARNEIKVFCVNGVELNVKQYKVPIWPNRIVYSFFRQPKATRAYEYALRLVLKGIKTPDPIAYILFKENGLFSQSYFISMQSPYAMMYDIGKRPANENKDVFEALGRYVARLHEAGVYHADFSPGNILFCRTAEGVQFSLIDINRMCFGPVSIAKGCANFARLWGEEAAFRLMARTYAEARGADVEDCANRILRHRNRFWKRYALKHEIEFEL